MRSGWLRADFWLGMPMKGIRVDSRLLDKTGLLIQLYGNPDRYAIPLTMLLEKAGVVPERSVLVGVQQDFPTNRSVLFFAHHAFPRVEEGASWPVEDAVVHREKWDKAVEEMRTAMQMTKQWLDEKAPA